MKICHEIMPPVKNDRNEETFQRAFEQMINKKITVPSYRLRFYQIKKAFTNIIFSH